MRHVADVTVRTNNKGFDRICFIISGPSLNLLFPFSKDFNKKKPAQEKAINDVVRDGQKLIDEDIVPTDKREAVELDLRSLPETWNDIVAKADENKKTYVVKIILHASIWLSLHLYN